MAQMQSSFVCPECKRKNVFYHDTNINYSMRVKNCDTLTGGCGKNCVVEVQVKLEVNTFKVVQ